MAGWQRLTQGWARAENFTLASLLATLIVLAITQMLARNLFSAGWAWIDPLTRVLVLWVGLAGAMIATRKNKHIAILVMRDALPARLQRWVVVLAHLVTAFTAGTLAYHGGRLVLIESAYPVAAFLNVPNWACQTIIPIAFGVIAVRSLSAAFGSARKHEVNA
jgi:TRAP-type C4-dicarboxylate transport system permease small subunit